MFVTDTMILRIHLLLLFLLASIETANAQGDSVIHIPVKGDVDNVQFTRNGAYLLTRQSDTVRVWGVPSGKPVGVPIVLSSGSGYASFLPGDTTILTVAYERDSVFNVWDWRTGERLRSVSLFRTISEAFVTADGKTLAIFVSFPQRQYELWNIVSGGYREVLLTGGYAGLLLDSVGNQGVVAKDGIINRIDAATHVVDTFHIPAGYLFRSYLSRDGSRAGFSMMNRPPLIFDVASGDSVFSLDIRMSDSADVVHGIRTRVTMGLSDDNHYITTITSRGADSSRLDVWDGVDGHHIAKVASESRLFIAMMKISPRNDYVAIYNTISGEMLLWPLRLPISSAPVVAGMLRSNARWYPNPATSSITLEWNQIAAGPGKMTILTSTGQQIQAVTWKSHEPGLCREHLSTAGWPSGQYFGRIETEGNCWVNSFIIEH